MLVQDSQSPYGQGPLNLLTHPEGVAFLVPLAMTSGAEEGGGVDLGAPALLLRGVTVHGLRASDPCIAT